MEATNKTGQWVVDYKTETAFLADNDDYQVDFDELASDCKKENFYDTFLFHASGKKRIILNDLWAVYRLIFEYYAHADQSKGYEINGLLLQHLEGAINEKAKDEYYKCLLDVHDEMFGDGAGEWIARLAGDFKSSEEMVDEILSGKGSSDAH
jgi:hypothetical protein